MMIRTSSHRGSALLLVLWALLFLSGAVLSWALWIQKGIVLRSEANRVLEARAMAHSGITIGLHPLVTRATPFPAETLVPGQGYRLRLVSEGGKLNLNWLVAGEEPAKIAILKHWLQQRGLDYQQCERLVDCLLDYCDGDNLARLNGNEEGDGYHPKNRPLQSVQELREVRGTEPLTVQAGWADELTVHSQGPIDLTGASAQVLGLLPGFGNTRIKKLLDYRAGGDGEDGTIDDRPVKDLKALQALLGMTREEFALLQGLVTVNDPTTQIISTGYSGTVTRTVEVVALKAGNRARILAWKE